MSWITVGVGVATTALGGKSARKERGRIKGEEQYAAGMEAQRQTKLDETRSVINRAFDSPQRQQQYADYATAMREYMGGELVRQKRDAARNLKFALAKSGQVGGSQQVAGNQRLGEEFQRGALENERRVQGGVASLKGADELARNNLLQLADTGIGLTDATRRASTVLSSNLGNANASQLERGMGDVFADTSAAYKAINERAAQRRGFGYKTNRQELYG